MADLFKAKVRRVGSSLGVLIPNEFAKQENIREGEEIALGVIKQRNLAEVLKMFGIAKGTAKFKRDRLDRV